jgi:hypothetical protein
MRAATTNRKVLLQIECNHLYAFLFWSAIPKGKFLLLSHSRFWPFSAMSTETSLSARRELGRAGFENLPAIIGRADEAARVGAAVQMRVGNYYVQNRRGWVHLHAKGVKVNELPSRGQISARRFRPALCGTRLAVRVIR